MSTKTWKDVERKIARWFGSERNPLSGSNAGHSCSDSLHHCLFIETKYRAQWAVLAVWRKAVTLAQKENKIPVVCLGEKGRHAFWVLVHSDDLTAVANQRFQAREAEGLTE